jgi:hypothetical protein
MMDMITTMVMQNAEVSHEQARKAIEAVLAYAANEMPEIGKTLATYVTNSNGTSAGGIDGGSILDNYRENFGELPIN